MVKSVSILGSTGTIGVNTLDVIAQHKNKFKIKALSAKSNVKLLIKQAQEFNAELVAIRDDSKLDELKSALPNIEVISGENAAIKAAQYDSDIMISAIVGFAALEPTMEAVKRGIQIGMANKEGLVCAGEIIMNAAKQYSATIIPIDSEHNAIYQLFDFENASSIEKIILTASGGPFRKMPLADLQNVTVAQAVNHPNWDMGKKISVDSATMMNKGLELIEAYNLFPIEINQLEAIIHPESYIHGLVYYNDGAVLAQAAMPDMRSPISYALGYPERLENNVERLDLTKLGKLHFEEPDLKRYPCLKLAIDAMQAGGSAPITLNAANEVAVEMFLNKQIKFTQIAEFVEHALNASEITKIQTLEEVIAADMEARKITSNKIAA